MAAYCDALLMAREKDTIRKAAERTAQLYQPSSHKSALKAQSITRVRFKISELLDEEKDKLLFEVFDVLLRNNNELPASPTPLASGAKKGRVKNKASNPHISKK
jgi:hypothetical protein